MSSYEPPTPPTPPGGTPPPGGPDYGQGPGQVPAGGYGGYGGEAQTGVPRPGELVDRFVARLIDAVLFFVVSFIIGAIFAAILISNDSIDLTTGEVDPGGGVFLANAVSAVLSTAIVLAYYGFLESTRGQTVGKMVMKLKVVGPDGTSNPTFQQAIMRNIWLALSLLGVLGTIGSVLNLVLSIAAIVVIVMGIQALPQRQTWFDKLAGGTQVLKVG